MINVYAFFSWKIIWKKFKLFISLHEWWVGIRFWILLKSVKNWQWYEHTFTILYIIWQYYKKMSTLLSTHPKLCIWIESFPHCPILYFCWWPNLLRFDAMFCSKDMQLVELEYTFSFCLQYHKLHKEWNLKTMFPSIYLWLRDCICYKTNVKKILTGFNS